MDSSCHINVKFLGSGLTSDEKGKVLLAFEKLARAQTGKPVEVFMDLMADDSKLRRGMTRQELDAL